MLGYIIIVKNKATKSKKFKVRYVSLFPASQKSEPRSSRPAQGNMEKLHCWKKGKGFKESSLCGSLRRGVSSLIYIMSSWYIAQSFDVKSLSCRQGMQTKLSARNNSVKTQECPGTIHFNMLLLLSPCSYLNSSKNLSGFCFWIIFKPAKSQCLHSNGGTDV